MNLSSPANSNTTPCGATLISLLQYWPRKYISELLLPHVAPHEFLLSGELEAALPVRWRRAKPSQPSMTDRTKKRTLSSARFKQPYADSSGTGGSLSSALCILDDGFPDALRYIPDPPLVLYLRGDETLLAQPSIAVVGARR